MRAPALLFALAACSSKSGPSPSPAPPAPPSNRGSGSGVATPTAGCACAADEQCVERFDGACKSRGLACIKRPASCPADAANACTASCGNAYCPRPFQCDNRTPCGGEVAGAFTCYGP
jgi:hypothetical protein